MTRVLAAVIRRGDTVLLCRRPLRKRHGGLWEFPGGKLEPGEGLAEAARRELSEELRLEATSLGRVLLVRQDPGSSFLIEFVEIGIAQDAVPVPLEHDEVRWCTPAEAALLPLAPADADLVAKLLATD